MLIVEPWFFLFATLLLLTVPTSWLAAACGAALVHEISHAAAIYFLGGNINAIQIGIQGTVMQTEIPGTYKTFIAALAGPAGSFLLLFSYPFAPKLALCGCMQGLFNLLPIYPLDGGRALHCLLDASCVGWYKTAFRVLEIITCALILIVSAIGSIGYSLGILPLLWATTMIFRAMTRKRPCKWRGIGVQ